MSHETARNRRYCRLSAVLCGAHYADSSVVWCTDGAHCADSSVVWCTDRTQCADSNVVWRTNGAHYADSSVVWCTDGAHCTDSCVVWRKDRTQCADLSVVWHTDIALCADSSVVWCTDGAHCADSSVVWCRDRAHCAELSLVWCTNRAHCADSSVVWHTVFFFQCILTPDGVRRSCLLFLLHVTIFISLKTVSSVCLTGQVNPVANYKCTVSHSLAHSHGIFHLSHCSYQQHTHNKHSLENSYLWLCVAFHMKPMLIKGMRQTMHVKDSVLTEQFFAVTWPFSKFTSSFCCVTVYHNDGWGI